MTGKTRQIIQLALLLGPISVMPVSTLAESAYIIDRIEVGIHSENTIDSPILSLVETGEELEVLQAGPEFSQVRAGDGSTGWVNSRYLVDEKPGSANPAGAQADSELLRELDTVKAEAAELKQQLSAAMNDSEAAEQINSMRLKIGELQAELTRLRIEQSNQQSDDELYEKIASLEQEKVELAMMIEEMRNPPDSSLWNDLARVFKGEFNARYLVYLVFMLIAGAVGGILTFDFINRRRHGGFRI